MKHLHIQQLFNFEGANALIIGGSSGLGKTMAESLAVNGAKVIIASRNTDKLKDVVQNINEYSENCTSHEVDIRSADSIEKLKTYVNSQFSGKLNILINSAGIVKRTSFADLTLEDWEDVHKTNNTGAFLLAKHFFSLLKTANWGRYINIASYFASYVSANRAAYCASKGALLQLTRSLAVEWAPHAITVNSISPGAFLTEMTKDLLSDPQVIKNMQQIIPLQRIGSVNELVTSCLYLASPASSYVTGVDLRVDGGWSCG